MVAFGWASSVAGRGRLWRGEHPCSAGSVARAVCCKGRACTICCLPTAHYIAGVIFSCLWQRNHWLWKNYCVANNALWLEVRKKQTAGTLKSGFFRASVANLGSDWITDIYERIRKKNNYPGLDKRCTSSPWEPGVCILQANRRHQGNRTRGLKKDMIILPAFKN